MNTLKLVTLQYPIPKATTYIQWLILYQIIINQKSLNLQRICNKQLSWQKNNIDTINLEIGVADTKIRFYEKFKTLLIQIILGVTDMILSYVGDHS
jgi:hypothetical protein